ncbi:hypothetical protein RCO28_34185, partial [Streptomyces sp. LHD-70]|uniref:hypothetical protein n=1 Tax=Streptomyces sp. LHD-70 TaxID=3072140 RepID=UPI00280F2EB5
GDGVSTYLALIFGTLLSSQGTDASFVLTLSGFPPGASLRCFQPYQILFPFRFLSEAIRNLNPWPLESRLPLSAFRLPFGDVPSLSEHFSRSYRRLDSGESEECFTWK